MPLLADFSSNCSIQTEVFIKYVPVVDNLTSETPSLTSLAAGVVDFCLILNLIFFEAVGVIGVVGNILNIIVFFKQGYTDSVNVTLTAIAVSDIGALLTGQLFCLIMNPWMLTSDIPVVFADLVAMTAFYPHNYFIRVSGLINAFASFERCLCVISPLKVKQIITKTTAIYINIFIFAIAILDLVPVYTVFYLEYIFFPNLNKTVLTNSARMNPAAVFEISYIVTDLLVPYFTFCVIIASNVIIGVQLNRRLSWRRSFNNTANVPSKDKNVVVMLAVMSTVFIVCLIPQSVTQTAVVFVPGLNSKGNYFDLALVCYCVSYMMETISSSVNIIIYYKMSTKFRETLLSICK